MIPNLVDDTAAHPAYRPDIDGLRALAVLAVVIFHAFPKSLGGGFIGVDIFFVISGFLISHIIFKSLDCGTFRFGDFYARRVRRIFPALLLVLTVTVFFGWYVLLPNEFAQLGKHMIGAGGFISNLFLWQEAGYFDVAAQSKPLLHLWSLGIEEQFYLFWPLLLWAAWKSYHRFLWLTGVIIIASFILNVVWIATDPVADFYSPFTRFWELLAGGVLAWIFIYHSRYLSRYTNAKSVLGILCIAVPLIILNKHSAFPGWWTLLPVLGAMLLLAAPQGWINQKILSSPPMAWCGRISYPLYLWHWPLLAFAYIIDPNLSHWGHGVLVAAAVLLAWGTYAWLEKPIRFQLPMCKTMITSLIAAAMLLMVLGTAVWCGAIPPRHDDPQLARVVQAVGDWEGLDDMFTLVKFEGRKFYQQTGTASKTLFIGDSHIEQYAARIHDLLSANPQAYQTAIFATRGGCAPLPIMYDPKHSDCRTTMTAAFNRAMQEDITTIVIGACWNCRLLPDMMHKNNHGGDSKESKDQDLDAKLDALAAELHDLSAHKKVFLVLDIPSGPMFDPAHFLRGSRLGHLEYAPPRERVQIENAAAVEELRKRLRRLGEASGAMVIDPMDTLCRADGCLATLPDGTPIYKDADHLRPFYVRAAAGFIDPTLQLVH